MFRAGSPGEYAGAVKPKAQDVASKSLSGLESLVDQIPSIAEGPGAAQAAQAAPAPPPEQAPAAVAALPDYAPALYPPYGAYGGAAYGNNGSVAVRGLTCPVRCALLTCVTSQLRHALRGLRRRLGRGRHAAHAGLPVGVAVRLRGARAGRLRALQRALLQRVRRPAARAPPAGTRCTVYSTSLHAAHDFLSFSAI